MKYHVFLTALLAALGQNGPLRAEKPDAMSIGPRFQHETSYGIEGLKTTAVTWGKNLPLYRQYPDATQIKLPAPGNTGVGIETAIDRRRSVRAFVKQALALTDLSRVLLTAAGVTHTRGGFVHRTYPSAGALYPLDLFVFASQVDSLAPGLYYFHPGDSSLVQIRSGEFGAELHDAANGQEAVGASPVTLVIAARFDRTTQKYADRGYRYAYIEAGAVCQNIYLQATASGLGAVAVGAFNDDAMNALLDLDGVHEAAMLMLPLGVPAVP